MDMVVQNQMESHMNFGDRPRFQRKTRQFSGVEEQHSLPIFRGNSGKLENHWLKVSPFGHTVPFVLGR